MPLSDAEKNTVAPRSCVVFNREKWLPKQNGYHLLEKGKYLIRTNIWGFITIDYFLPKAVEPSSLSLLLKETGWVKDSTASPTTVKKEDANKHISSFFRLIEKIPKLQGLERMEPVGDQAVDQDSPFADYEPSKAEKAPEVKDTADVTAASRSCVVFNREELPSQNGYTLLKRGQYLIRTSSKKGVIAVDYWPPDKEEATSKNFALKETGWEEGSTPSTEVGKDDANKHISGFFTLIEKNLKLKGWKRIDPVGNQVVGQESLFGDYKPLILSNAEKNIWQEYLHKGKNAAGQPRTVQEYEQYFKSRQEDLKGKLGFLIVGPSSPESGNSLEIVYQDPKGKIQNLKCDYLMGGNNKFFVSSLDTQDLIKGVYRTTQIDKKAIEEIQAFMNSFGRKWFKAPIFLLDAEKAATVQQTISEGRASPVLSEVKDTADVTTTPRSCVVFNREKLASQNGYTLLKKGQYLIRTSSKKGVIAVDYWPLDKEEATSRNFVLKVTGWEEGSTPSTEMGKDDANKHISGFFTLIEKNLKLKGWERIDPVGNQVVGQENPFGDYKPLIPSVALSIQSLEHKDASVHIHLPSSTDSPVHASSVPDTIFHHTSPPTGSLSQDEMLQKFKTWLAAKYADVGVVALRMEDKFGIASPHGDVQGILADLENKGLKGITSSSNKAFSVPIDSFSGIMDKIDLDLSSLPRSKVR